MNDQSFALKLEGVFHRLQENLAGKDFSHERHDPDRGVYLLVVAGGRAGPAHNLVAAAARYADEVRKPGGDPEAARQSAVAALDDFAADGGAART
jgi:hypothetical protein